MTFSPEPSADHAAPPLRERDMHTQQLDDREATAPPAWRRRARKVVGGALAAVLLASGLSTLAAPAAQAADTVGLGSIKSPTSPMTQVTLGSKGQMQITQKALGDAFFGASAGIFDGTTYASGTSITGGVQTYGGSGTSASPFWLNTTGNIPTGTFSTRMSYVPGAAYVRNDISFTNTQATTKTLQLTGYADCKLAGLDLGTTTIVPGSTGQCINTANSTVSLIAATPGAAIVGGSSIGLTSYTLKSPIVGTAVANTCVGLSGQPASCSAVVDNGLALAWKKDVAPGATISATYFSSYGTGLDLSDLGTDLAVSSPTVNVGDTVDYTVSASNSGPQDTDGASVVFPLPAGMQFVSAQGGTYDPATGAWSIGALETGGSRSLVVTARAMQAGTTTASIASAGSNNIDITSCVSGSTDNCGSTATVTAVDAASTAASTISAAPATVPADGTPSTITVTTTNGLGAPFYDAGASIALTSTLGTLSNVTDNGDGTYTATLSSTVPGTATVSFTINGAPATATAPVVFSALPGSAAKSTLSVTSTAAVANGSDTQPASVKVLDAQGNPVSGATVGFTVDGAASLSASSAVSDANGVATVFVTSATPGSYAVHATIDGAEVSGSPAQATFTVGAPDAASSTFQVSAGTKTADGSDAHTLTATVKDAQGHPVAGATVSFGAATGATPAATSAITGADGVATTTVTSTKAGSYAVTAALGSTAIAGSPKNVAFVAGAVDASASSFAVTPGTVTADGVATHRATVTATDAKGNPVAGARVDFQVPAGVTASASSAVTGADGVASVTLTSTTAATYAISASIAGATVKGAPANVVFAAGAANAAKSTWTVTPNGSVTADGTQKFTATATARDAAGNPVSGAVIAFGVTPTGVSISPAAQCTTGADGTCQVTFTSTKAGSYTATASLGGSPIGATKTLVFTAGTAAVSTSTIIASPATVGADGTPSTLTVQLRDAKGNPLTSSGGTVVIRTDNGAVTSTTDNGDGTYTAALSSTAEGFATVSFTLDGATAPATTIVVFSDVTAPNAPILEPSDGVRVTGQAEPFALITITDAAGNPVATGYADENGWFSILLPTADPLADGTKLLVTATDKSDNESPASSITIDRQAPQAPVVDATQGATVSGTAEPGSTVTVTDALGHPIGTGQAGADGTFSITLSPAANDGDVLRVTAADAAGNVSPETQVVADATAPQPPAVSPSNGTVVTGTAEPGSTVTVADENGTVLGTVTADARGDFTFVPTTPLTDGTVLSVTSTDAAGNTSKPSTITIDAERPEAPLVDPSTGTSVTGTGEPGSTVTVTGTDGTVLGTAIVDENGSFTFVPSTPIPDGTSVLVTVTDASGNVSEATPLTIDSSAPDAPAVFPSNGSTVSGTAEPGTVVTIRAEDGTVLGTAVAGLDSTFTVTLEPAATTGDTLTATATDATGNVSASTDVSVNSDVPTSPVVKPSGGTTVAGTAEPGATITVKDADGNTVGTGTADDTGSFTITLDQPATDGAVLTVIATNEVGTESLPSTITVDAEAPAAPVVAPTQGGTLTGTAEPGSTVTVKGEDGTVIGTGTAGTDGSFTIELTPGLPDGGTATVTATDPAGNESPATEITADRSAPDAAHVDPTQGDVVTGTAEPGSTVTVTDTDGNVIGTGTVGPDGTFTVTLQPALGDGETAVVTVTDPAGNTSLGTEITADRSEPNAPIVDPTQGDTIAGTAEPGSTVTVTDADGNVIGTGTAGPDGTFTIALEPALGDGQTATVTATDPAGNESAATSVTADRSLPDAPVVDATQGDRVTGTAEPGSTVTVTDADGNVIGTGTAGPDGTFTVTLQPALGEGETAAVTATDPAGNTSPATEITADRSAPDAAQVDPTQGGTVTGTAEPGSTITVTDADGNVIGTGTAGPDGTFTVTLQPGLGDGETATVTVTDPAGNTSPGTQITADSAAPTAPVVDPTQGDRVTGTAEPGSVVTVKDADGAVIGTGTADADGRFTIDLVPGLPDGGIATVTATDAAGNESAETQLTADRSAPTAPTVHPSNGKTITGTAEPGSVVTVKDADGTVIGTAVADGTGAFTLTPSAPLADGTVLVVTATDAAGNVSEETRATVDAAAPAAPVLDPTDGTTVTGTAEPGSTVTVRDENGTVIGTAVAGEDGRFSITLDAPLAAGTSLTVTATDAAGNESAATRITVEKPATSGNGGSTAPTGGLASTGSDVLPIALGALLLLAAGGFLIALRLRRRREEEEVQH